MNSLSTTFRHDDLTRNVEIEGLVFSTTLPVEARKLNIGDLEFEIKDVLSSPLFSKDMITLYPPMSHYVLINLSDFTRTQRGVETLLRFWHYSSFLASRLHLVLEKHHLVNNPELVLKWFEKTVLKRGLGEFSLIAREKDIDRLNDFILSGLIGSGHQRDIDLMETIVEVTKESDDFLNYVNDLMSGKNEAIVNKGITETNG